MRSRNPHWRAAKRQEDAAELWRRVVDAAQVCSVLRARAALLAASPELIDEARSGPLGLITPVIRAAGARKTKAAAAPRELLETVRLALDKGFSADAPCPQVMAWEIWSPPLVTAASYGYEDVCEELLRRGASPSSRNSDGDTALHVAVEQPRALRQLLRAADFRALVGAENRWRLTPLVSALVASPFKAKHWECALLLAPHALLSDRDLAVLAARRRVPRLASLAHALAVASGRRGLPADAMHWHPAWHWSFPPPDRQAASLLRAHSAQGSPLPPELWLHVLSFCRRGWFAAPAREQSDADEPLLDRAREAVRRRGAGALAAAGADDARSLGLRRRIARS